MQKVLAATLVLVLALAFAVVAAEPSRMELKVGDQVYVCACGESCPCDSMARRASKCACGKDLEPGTVTQVGDGTAVIKTSAAERTFKTVGKYACACGAACDCGSISQHPGKCACGKDLAAVEKAM